MVAATQDVLTRLRDGRLVGRYHPQCGEESGEESAFATLPPQVPCSRDSLLAP